MASAPTVQLEHVGIPRIRTARLLLREARESDFAAYEAQVTDPDAARFTGGVVDRRGAWRQFLTMSGSWIVNGGGWWQLEDVESGASVGTVGAFFRETNIGRGRDADLELGWSIYRAFWRRGFASEAAAAALAWAGARHDPARIIAHISDGNVPSVAVAKKLGFTVVGPADFYGEPVTLHAIERPPAGWPPLSGATRLR